MLTNKVRTYHPKQPQPALAIYILSRGLNAGKPLREPCPNCYILYCTTQGEADLWFWLFQALTDTGYFRPHLCGSLIMMLRLSDLKKLLHNEIQPMLSRAELDPEKVAHLCFLDDLERNYRQRADGFRQLRQASVRQFFDIL